MGRLLTVRTDVSCSPMGSKWTLTYGGVLMVLKPKEKLTWKDYGQMLLIAIGTGVACYLAIILWL
jgi:hypothetical protein